MYEKALVFNDLHIPWHCQRAIDLMLRIGKDLDPDLIVINGDLVDMWEVSKYVKNPLYESKGNLFNEIEMARVFLWDLREKFPNAKIVYIFGNHEFRWAAYIAQNAKPLYKLKGMSLEEQLGCKEFDIEVKFTGNKESSWQYGQLLIGHFNKVNKHSGYTAKNLLEEKSISLIQAHTHRLGSSFKRLWDRDIVAYENGCLCDRNPQYVDRPNWQLGFSVIYKDKDSDFHQVVQHYIQEKKKGNRLNYRCFYNGREYTN